MDIVERLRKLDFIYYPNDAADISEEAADEIERLRKDCDRMASLAIDNAKDTERAMRYRNALNEINERASGDDSWLSKSIDIKIMALNALDGF